MVPEDVAKTSLPQSWHIPRGDKIQGVPVQDVALIGHKGKNALNEKESKSIKTTLYSAVRGEVPNCTDLFDPLKNVQPDCQILPAIK